MTKLTLKYSEVRVGKVKFLGLNRDGVRIYSGYDKQPFEGELIKLTQLGIESDRQEEQGTFGGLHLHAFYDRVGFGVFDVELAFWQERTGRTDLELLGQNFTFETPDGFSTDMIHIGDVFRGEGGVLIQVTGSRLPCDKTNIAAREHYGISDETEGLADMMLRLGYTGMTFSVIEEGLLPTRGTFKRIWSNPEHPTLPAHYQETARHFTHVPTEDSKKDDRYKPGPQN